jgi:hypothetical protein
MNSVRREWISLMERQLWVRHQIVLAKLNSGEDVLHDDDKLFHEEIDELAKSIEQRYGSDNLEVQGDYERGVLEGRVAALGSVLNLHHKFLKTKKSARLNRQ